MRAVCTQRRSAGCWTTKRCARQGTGRMAPWMRALEAPHEAATVQNMAPLVELYSGGLGDRRAPHARGRAWQGKPVDMPMVSWKSGRTSSAGTARLSWTSLTISRSNAFISTIARRLPKHSRGPALNTGYSKALGGARPSQRSGLKASASSPQRSVDRAMAYALYCTTVPLGMKVPSGRVSSPMAILLSSGTDGYSRRPSWMTFCT
mmetsp:Transcript_30784/g.93132  ORF Transcript_30784/g.93132 Transcript_30784/m.93132 type:complete len:206 (-) Transcript_30784:1149-1766(-)